ncbi:MAG TPA: hypothetical protein VGF06_08565, partial [Terriglobales bacterium]
MLVASSSSQDINSPNHSGAKPARDAPRIEKPKTPLDLDHQFDAGSGIALETLTPVQVESLLLLGKVWGFLKYHHPKVTSGQVHWDYELLRVLPNVLAVNDRRAIQTVLMDWIDTLGPILPCNPCARLDEKDLSLRPDLDWISNNFQLGDDLSRKLLEIYRNRPLSGRQFYVSLVPGIHNPSFSHELAYSNLRFPDPGFQLLALYRFWNIIEYWAPYRDVVGEDWNGVLAEFIPRVALAKTADDYMRELMALIAKAHDGHANLWNSLKARPPIGECFLPVKIRFVENAAVITGISAASSIGADLKVGDVIAGLDGTPVAKLVESWAPYYATSNDAARMRDTARYMTRGKCGDTKIAIRRKAATVTVTEQRVPAGVNDYDPGTHDLPGPTFRLLSKDLAYLKLSSIKEGDAMRAVEQAAGTKGLIIDIRNYPSSFEVFELGSLLVDKQTSFARFTEGDMANPGSFHW